MFKNLNPGALGVTGHQSEVIELALSFGFGGMDLNIVEFATRARLKGLDYAKRLIESSKLDMGTFELPFDLDWDDSQFQKGLAKLPEYAQAAAAIDCKRCIATVAPVNSELPYHANFERHLVRIQEICKIFEPLGIRLGLGFHAEAGVPQDHTFQFIHDLDALMTLIDMAGVPNVGLLLDIWDIVASGGSLQSIQKLSGKQIVAVQIADMPPDVPVNELDEKSRLLPGAEGGPIDFVALLVHLKSIGYDGPVTLKPSRSALPSRRRDLVAKQAGEVFDKIWRAAGLPSEKKFVATATTSYYQGDYNNT